MKEEGSVSASLDQDHSTQHPEILILDHTPVHLFCHSTNGHGMQPGPISQNRNEHGKQTRAWTRESGKRFVQLRKRRSVVLLQARHVVSLAL